MSGTLYNSHDDIVSFIESYIRVTTITENIYREGLEEDVVEPGGGGLSRKTSEKSAQEETKLRMDYKLSYLYSLSIFIKVARK